jgi:hypothetical protein
LQPTDFLDGEMPLPYVLIRILRACQKRAAVMAEVRVVTREEMALERVAVRERRKLAQEATGEDRAAVLPQIEADRREQLGRAQAAADRRVERRQGLGIGEFREKLLTQARALRERIGQQLGRVKEWVLERFPEQIKSRTRELFGRTSEPTPAAPFPEAVPLDLGALKARGRTASEGWRQTLHQRQAAERRAEVEREAQLRRQQLEAERAARERQALAERQAREQAMRQRTVEQFRDLAASREMKRFGYEDQSEDWRATPPVLRERIDQFNALEPDARQLALERLLQAPARGRGLTQLQQLMDEREKLVKALDRGMEL